MALYSLLLVFALLPALAISTSHQQLYSGLKSMHFTCYQHDTVGKTDYLIVKGVAGAPFSQSTTPLGTIYVLQDPLTSTPELSSKVVGTVEGMTVSSSFDGFDNLSVGRITLNWQGHKGSISVVGVSRNVKPADLPVVGGTGDFLLVQGYVTATPISSNFLTLVIKMEFHLYWPPYAAQVTRG